MYLRGFCSKSYKLMGPLKLKNIAKQQFIFDVQNNVMRKKLIVHPIKFKTND